MPSTRTTLILLALCGGVALVAYTNSQKEAPDESIAGTPNVLPPIVIDQVPILNQIAIDNLRNTANTDIYVPIRLGTLTR